MCCLGSCGLLWVEEGWDGAGVCARGLGGGNVVADDLLQFLQEFFEGVCGGGGCCAGGGG